MTQAEISFLLKMYLDNHRLSLVDYKMLKNALETAEQEMLSVLVTLLTNQEFSKC